MYEADERQEQEIHLRDYLHVLQKRKWLLIATVVVAFSTAAIVSFRTRPLYQSAAQIMIEMDTARILPTELMAQNPWGTQDYLNTQYRILQSTSLAVKVAERLRIWELAEFASGTTGSAKANTAQETEVRLDAAAAAILSRVSIEPVRNSYLVNVRARAFDPKVAALLANTLSEVYIEQNLEIKVGTTKQTDKFLGEQTAEARLKLAESERALQGFNEANNVISMEERQAGMTANLGRLNAELAKTRMQRQELESRNQKLREMLKRSGDVPLEGLEYSMPQFAANTSALRAELNGLEADLAEQSKTYTPKHPKIVALLNKIQTLRDRLAEEVKRAALGLNNEYELSVKTEQSLESQIKNEELALKNLNAKGLEHAVLKREVASNMMIYQQLAAREKETGVLSNIRTNNIRMVDRAKVPVAPFSPNRPRALALGLFVGLVGGLGLAFFLEYLDDSVSDPDQLERYVHIPFLGPVPLLEPKETGPLARDLIALKEPKSVYAEAYRAVRTSILFSSPDDPPRVFVVTSSGQQEGKTLTAVNLAITMALNDKRVLLIDADMRKPRIHRIFGVENKFGLSSLIGGSPDVGLALKATSIPTLMVIPSGPIPPNPSELLGTARLGKLIGMLRERFDVVIFDCTPLIAVTDATVLATQVDGVILVIKSGATRRKILKRGVKQLEDVQAKIVGAVLNQVNVKNSSYYYAYYYSHYYGEREDLGKGSAKAGAKPVASKSWWKRRSA
jgi:capsular exopolysaccharide synthesis family protein